MKYGEFGVLAARHRHAEMSVSFMRRIDVSVDAPGWP